MSIGIDDLRDLPASSASPQRTPFDFPRGFPYMADSPPASQARVAHLSDRVPAPTSSDSKALGLLATSGASSGSGGTDEQPKSPPVKGLSFRMIGRLKTILRRVQAKIEARKWSALAGRLNDNKSGRVGRWSDRSNPSARKSGRYVGGAVGGVVPHPQSAFEYSGDESTEGSDADLSLLRPAIDGTEEVHYIKCCCVQCRVLDPRKKCRMSWDVVVIIALLYNIIEIPFRVCFDVDTEPWSFEDIINLCVDIFFLCDVGVNFVTGFYVENRMIVEQRKIAIKYLKGWFWLDLLTSIPIGQIMHVVSDSSGSDLLRLPRLFRIARIARLVKLFRMLKLMRVMSQWESRSSQRTFAVVIKICKVMLNVFLIGHIFACLWALIPMLERDGVDFQVDSWPYRYGITSSDDTTPGKLYLICLYWALSSLSTVGYGDITPQRRWEYGFVCFTVFVGTCIFGYILGHVTSMISEKSVAQKVRAKIKEVNSYMNIRKVDRRLQEEVRTHFEFAWRRTMMYNEKEILSELPHYLRSELALHLNQDLIDAVPFLSKMGEDCLAMLVLRLNPLQISPGQCIFEAGSLGREMYFVSRGEVEVYQHLRNVDEVEEKSRDSVSSQSHSGDKVDDDLHNFELVCSLKSGSYFGELAILKSGIVRRCFTIKAKTFVDLLSLSKHDFEKIQQVYPNIYQNILRRAKDQWKEAMKRIGPSTFVERKGHELPRYNSKSERLLQTQIDKLDQTSQRMNRANSREFASPQLSPMLNTMTKSRRPMSPLSQSQFSRRESKTPEQNNVMNSPSMAADNKSLRDRMRKMGENLSRVMKQNVRLQKRLSMLEANPKLTHEYSKNSGTTEPPPKKTTAKGTSVCPPRSSSASDFRKTLESTETHSPDDPLILGRSLERGQSTTANDSRGRAHTPSLVQYGNTVGGSEGRHTPSHAPMADSRGSFRSMYNMSTRNALMQGDALLPTTRTNNPFFAHPPEYLQLENRSMSDNGSSIPENALNSSGSSGEGNSEARQPRATLNDLRALPGFAHLPLPGHISEK